MFVWCTDVTGKLDIDAFVKKLAEEYKVAVISGDVFMPAGGKSHSFRLNFTVPEKDEIKKGVEGIGKALA